MQTHLQPTAPPSKKPSTAAKPASPAKSTKSTNPTNPTKPVKPAYTKTFMTGGSQAVRLPKAFRVNAEVLWISKDALTGNLILSEQDPEAQRLAELEAMFKEFRENPLPADDFDDIISRDQTMDFSNPLGDWDDDLPEVEPAKSALAPLKLKRKVR